MPMAAQQQQEYSVQDLYAATGGFHRLSVIGEGGFGKVYRAMVNLTPVAIKVLDHEGLQGMTEFQNEVRLARSIQHPHLVRLLGYTAEGSTQCLVYELLTNGNLEDRLSCRGGAAPLLWPARVKAAAQVADALAYLHSMGVIHRDIKPANMFLDCNLAAKLGDIGLASLEGWRQTHGRLASQSSGNSNGDAIGTWAYLAPEIKSGGSSPTAASDTYAFGLSLLQLVLCRETRDIIKATQQALEESRLAQVVDGSGGAWDMAIAERMLKLGLWCCMHDPRMRPPLATIHQELARMLALVVATHGPGLEAQ